jgi:hypothetical protein
MTSISKEMSHSQQDMHMVAPVIETMTCHVAEWYPYPDALCSCSYYKQYALPDTPQPLPLQH